MVKQAGENNFHAQRIPMPDGGEIVFQESKNTELGSGDMSADYGGQGRPTSSVSNITISQNQDGVNARYVQNGEKQTFIPAAKQHNKCRWQMKCIRKMG